MKTLLFLILFIAPVFCFAQADTTAHKQKVIYCLAEVYQNGSKCYMIFDDGSTKGKNGIEIKDSKGKTMEFDSRITALNYVTQLGWTLVSSYTVREGAIGFVFERTASQK